MNNFFECILFTILIKLMLNLYDKINYKNKWKNDVILKYQYRNRYTHIKKSIDIIVYYIIALGHISC